jgi:hypothetical protein
MSEFLSNNKAIAIHVTVEALIFGISMYVIYRKASTISENARELEERVINLENIVKDQKKIIDNLITRFQTPSPIKYYTPPHQTYQPPTAPSQPYTAPSQPYPPSQPYTAPSQPYPPSQPYTAPSQPYPPSQPYTAPSQQLTSLSQTIPQTYTTTTVKLATIVENEEDELDRSLKEELEELK